MLNTTITKFINKYYYYYFQKGIVNACIVLYRIYPYL